VEIRSARINVWNENAAKTFICNTGSLASWIWLHGCWSSNLCVLCFKRTYKFPMLASLPPPEWSIWTCPTICKSWGLTTLVCYSVTWCSVGCIMCECDTKGRI
jgi:hypothetical protein